MLSDFPPAVQAEVRRILDRETRRLVEDLRDVRGSALAISDRRERVVRGSALAGRYVGLALGFGEVGRSSQPRHKP